MTCSQEIPSREIFIAKDYMNDRCGHYQKIP